MGYTIFETTDHRQLMHLRDTEHNAGRILAEMERDKARGDVPPPKISIQITRRPSGILTATLLFQQWVGSTTSASV